MPGIEMSKTIKSGSSSSTASRAARPSSRVLEIRECPQVDRKGGQNLPASTGLLEDEEPELVIPDLHIIEFNPGGNSIACLTRGLCLSLLVPHLAGDQQYAWTTLEVSS
jgi:hypothetical protein